MFAIFNMLLMTGVEISNKQQCAKQTAISKIWKHCKSHIQSVRNVGNDYLNYFSIVSMMRLTGVEISNKPKCAKQTAISKTLQIL